MERIGMSQKERDRLDWLKRAQDGSMTQREAAQKMGVSERWVRTLLKGMKKRGDGVVVHALRGRASNRKIVAKEQARARELLKQAEWHDFGPTFVSQQLAKRHQLEVSKETLRAWMIEAGLWKPGSRAKLDSGSLRQGGSALFRRGHQVTPLRPHFHHPLCPRPGTWPT